MKDNYIPHWGQLYVAGKVIERGPAGDATGFDIIIEGVYTLESAGTAVVDGRPVEPGSTVHLSIGSHEISREEGTGPVTLRWGDNLYAPTGGAPPGPLYRGFVL